MDGVKALFTYLKDNAILDRVSAIIVDKDTKVRKYVRERSDCDHIEYYYDPGHVKKNLMKSLITLSIKKITN
jgi:hypothetical protein